MVKVRDPVKKKHGLPYGLQLTNKGYLRYTAGSQKWKLVHRRKMEIMLEQTHPLTLSVLGIELNGRGKIDFIDEKWDIHHIDGNKLNNNTSCLSCSNLMLLSHSVHAIFFEDR